MIGEITHHALRFSMAKPAAPKKPIQELDLAPYAGRWVAIVRGCVTGVGETEKEARLASKHQRPKDEPQIVFVPEGLTEDERPCQSSVRGAR